MGEHFAHLKVEEIKFILRSRGAKVTGKKKKLIEMQVSILLLGCCF